MEKGQKNLLSMHLNAIRRDYGIKQSFILLDCGDSDILATSSGNAYVIAEMLASYMKDMPIMKTVVEQALQMVRDTGEKKPCDCSKCMENRRSRNQHHKSEREELQVQFDEMMNNAHVPMIIKELIANFGKIANLNIESFKKQQHEKSASF